MVSRSWVIATIQVALVTTSIPPGPLESFGTIIDESVVVLILSSEHHVVLEAHRIACESRFDDEVCKYGIVKCKK